LKKLRHILVDTYALIAAATDTTTPVAEKVFESIKLGKVIGVIHYAIAFEFIVQWAKGRIPAFKTRNEVTDFLKIFFQWRQLTYREVMEAARIKVEGDKLLRKAAHPELKGRKLSLTDATSISLAMIEDLPILTGDRDLTYVAKHMGVDIIW